jgi:hypothetical protein
MECAIEFDGELTSLILIQGGLYDMAPDSSMSISLWYQGGSDADGDLESLFIKYGNGPDPHSNVNFGLQLYDLNTPLMSSPTYSVWANQSGIVFPNDPDWHHLVGVFELGTWTLYMDNSISGAFSGPQAIIGNGSADIAVGPGFEGKLDDILLYDRALTTSEVEQIFFAGSQCTVGLFEQLKELDVSIFPNPTSEILEIDLKKVSSDRLRIINLQGKVCLQHMVTGPILKVDITSLTEGNYVLEFYSQDRPLGAELFIKGD